MTALMSKLIVKRVESILKGRAAVNSQQGMRAAEESVKVTSGVDIIKVIMHPSVMGRDQLYILLISIPYS